MNVPALTIARFSGSPVVGSTTAAMADRPKATDPARLTAPSHHAARRPAALGDRWHTRLKAIALEMRKAIEPNRSGAQIRRSSCRTVRFSMRAAPVLMLKNKVPTSWIPDAIATALRNHEVGNGLHVESPGDGGGPFERWGISTSVPLLTGFIIVCVAELIVGAVLWSGRPIGSWLALALLPFELAYWIGFALPFGLILGAIRTVLVVAALLGL